MIHCMNHSVLQEAEYLSIEAGWLTPVIGNRGPEQQWPKYFCGLSFGHTK